MNTIAHLEEPLNLCMPDKAANAPALICIHEALCRRAILCHLVPRSCEVSELISLVALHSNPDICLTHACLILREVYVNQVATSQP